MVELNNEIACINKLINKRCVPVYGEKSTIVQVVKSQIFQDWVSNLDPEFVVHSITIQSVDMAHCTKKPRVLFIKFEAQVSDKQGNPLSGIVFLRGGAVGMLVILNCKGKKYVVLATEPRFAIGKFDSAGLPAGMLDGDGNWSGKAAKELEEEVGLIINENDLIDLTKLVYENRFLGLYPSAGGCDEFIRLFLLEMDVDFSFIEKMQGKQTGAAEENEQITLSVIPLEEIITATSDMKALVAYLFYTQVYMKRRR